MATYEYLSYGSPDGCIVNASSEPLGFYGGNPATKQTISGSVSSGAGVSSIAVALAAIGLCTNSLTA
jgi:hypothetical protein